jgi:hypothetical protein
LFGRCLRLFFFYQKKEVYETLMLHDYGFYKFEKFDNYLTGPEKDHLRPLFTTRVQFLVYDECSLMIGCCFQFLELRLRSKEYEGKIASKIANKVFSYFACAFLKEEATINYVQTLVEQLILE